MKNKILTRRLVFDSLLLVISFALVLITGKDGPKYRPLPTITPNYLLEGTKTSSSDAIFDYYDIGNDEYAVSLKDDIKNTHSAAIVVPDHIPEDENKKVTGIWHNAFHNTPTTSITFETPGNIKTIDFEAFLYSGITSIAIPYSVSAIGDAAFYSCNSLTTVVFVNSSQTTSGSACSCDPPAEGGDEEDVVWCQLTRIPSYCFFKCQSLSTISFPSSLIEIAEDAFNGCYSLISPLFFQNLTTIRSRAFQGCIGLTSVYIPSTMFNDASGPGIEPHAFNYCDTSLEFVFSGDSDDIDDWLANHPDWGWRTDSNPSDINGRYSITRIENGDTYFTSDWSYSSDADGNVTLKSYNGPTPTSATGYLISIPNSMPSPANNKVRRIEVGVFNNTVKAALRRLYLPNTLWAIENKMFATGYSNLFIIDDTAACSDDGGYTTKDYPGRIDLSGLKELEFIGVHAFARNGGGLAQKSKIKSIHLPANLRSIGDEAFGVFQQRQFPSVEEFIWDFNETTSRLETIGADCFYGLGIGGNGNIQGNVDWKSHKSSTIVFPKSFKYFGILQSDENRYRTQQTNPFNFQLYNGEAEKATKWERPAHAFIGCSLISTVIFKGSSNSSETTDLLIPLQTFVYNESLHTIIFEERNGRYITFHTQQGTGGQDYSQECIGANAGRGKNDFRGEPFLQTIVLPNKTTKLRFQKFAFHGNSRAAMYFSGDENTNIFSDKGHSHWRNLIFDEDNTDMSRAEQWKTIGNEEWTSCPDRNDGKGYFGYCFASSATSTSKVDESTLNSFSINQEIPCYYNIHYAETFELNSGSINVEVGGGDGCKELVIDNKVITEPTKKYPSYCAYVCETDTTRPSGKQNIATMSKYLYDIHESDRLPEIRRGNDEKETVRVLDEVTVNATTYKVVKIGDSAFSASFCDSDKDNSIGAVGSFKDLKNIELPDSIESIGEYAFIRCYGVEKISAYTSGAATAADYEMPSKLTFIGKNAFLFSGIKEVRKIPASCKFYENNNETEKITSVFANCLSLRVITFTTSSDRSTEASHTDCYETTTYTSATGSKTYTSALYSTNDAGVAYNKNKLLVVLNRNSDDVNKASANHLSAQEGTVSGDGIHFNGSFKSGAFLFGAYKMGMWIKELDYGTDSTDDNGAQSLFSAVGVRTNKTLSATYFYLYNNGIPFDTMDCDLDTIGGNVLDMPKYALKGCENLTTVNLPNRTDGVIPEGLFSDATSADFVTDGTEGHDPGVMDLSNTGYISIGKNSIKGNTTITKFIAPSVSSFTIGESAFEACSNLAELDLSGVTGTLTINKKAFASTAVNGPNITWPSSPCSINIEGDGAFSNCLSMTEISLPVNTTTTLGKQTFSGCTNLTTVTADGNSSITKFNDEAFKNCSSLTSFDFTKFTALTTIGASAFENAGSLSSTFVNLPSTVNTIGANAFKNSQITSVQFNSSTNLNVGNFAFASCASLSSVTFSNAACTWNNNGYGQGMFNKSTNLTELQLPTGFDINNSKYSGTGTGDGNEKNYFVLNDTNVKVYTHRKFTSSTSTSSGWRRTSNGGAEVPLYFLVDTTVVDNLISANVIGTDSTVKNPNTLFWIKVDGHAIPLGNVDTFNYSTSTIRFSSGYIFNGSTFVAP